jgi:hypothetical protein
VPVIDLSLFRNWTFRWASAAILVLGVGFGMQLLGLVLWFQEGWGWSPIRTGLAVAPGPAMVMVTAIGLRPFTSKLPIGLVVGAGILLRAVGGALIALSLTTHDNYASEALPGWLIVGIGVGLSMPTLVAAATRPAPKLHRQRRRTDGPADRLRPRSLHPGHRPRLLHRLRQRLPQLRPRLVVVGRNHDRRHPHLHSAPDAHEGGSPFDLSRT